MKPITPEVLLHAYASGVFPMADDATAEDIYWVDPNFRGIFPLDGFHISRSLARALRRDDYTVDINQDFAGVVRHCADRDTTWINAEIFDLYTQLHAMGFAHSLEVRRDGNLIGGVYGVAMKSAFFGESMFSTATNGSKIALAYLVNRLRAAGFTLFDTQFLTPHLASLGAIEIPKASYHKRLAAALAHPANFTAPITPNAATLLSQAKEALTSR